MSDPKEFELESLPTDTPASVKFAKKTNHLLVASWDSSLKLYNVDSKQMQASYNYRAPVLDCAFSADETKVYGGGADSYVRQHDIQTGSLQTLGQHAGVVSQMVYSSTVNAVISGSWDHTIRFWDPRSSTSPVLKQDLPERVYNMDYVSSSSTLVVALAGRQMEVYDVRKMDEPKQKRESSLKFMTKSLAAMPDGQGYAIGSVEGRIALEYFDPSPAAQAKNYAFKCHRQTVDGEDRVWPVNALAFHPLQGTFVSGGSDGAVAFWDHAAKKRLRQLPKFSAAVSSLSFNHDGTKLAIGVGYMHDGGLGDKASKNTIYIREIGDEAKVRSK
ncbi:WD40 repeat-like protein [Sistotremastrum niveocremeum HHB9708]|uniref:WD40 repeat-like protein n=2 Tax=Sistotremastraceae TaxID=3402574 RepID=A0A164XYL0_9AGAM|nr:WD40 repeat-like protein [Sistotremastrum niveocremeum HHB9708]KZT40722.1 WD40 repeat-like protein [Sistotremastrum suecicum HHB10207 ss-3]